MARRKRKPMASAILGNRGGRLSARHMRFSACFLRTICRRRAALSPSVPRFPARWGIAFGIGMTRAEPRRRPGVRLRTRPAGAAPRPASTHASRSAPSVDEVMRSLSEVSRAGITLAR